MPPGEHGRYEDTAREVPCPWCGLPHRDATELRLHVEAEHGTTFRRQRVGPGARAAGRGLRRVSDGLRFLPLWFVLPLNVGVAVLIYQSFRNPWHPALALLVRFAMLPSILLLAERVAGRRPML